MNLKHIFISHSSEDAEIASELAEHFRNADHETKVDTQNLDLGDNAIAFMNEGISNAAAVIILFSTHTPKAEWQKLEIDAAVWNQVAQRWREVYRCSSRRNTLAANPRSKSIWDSNPWRSAVAQKVSGQTFVGR